MLHANEIQEGLASDAGSMEMNGQPVDGTNKPNAVEDPGLNEREMEQIRQRRGK